MNLIAFSKVIKYYLYFILILHANQPSLAASRDRARRCAPKIIYAHLGKKMNSNRPLILRWFDVFVCSRLDLSHTIYCTAKPPHAYPIWI